MVPRKRGVDSTKAWLSKLARMKRKAQVSAKRAGMDEAFRSGFEFQVAVYLKHLGVPFEFEKESFIWTPRPIEHKYTPDFKICTASGKTIYIETKGRFMPADMEKQLAVKEQHPDADIRLVFSNPHTWFREAKSRSYGKWATENGFIWTSKAMLRKVLPQWLKE